MASNNYVCKYIPSGHPCYERDGLATWYEEFLRDPKIHFKNTKIANFDII